MKNLIIFLAGILAGITGVFFYQVFGKPASPKSSLIKPATGVEHTMLQFKKDGECGEPWGNPTALTIGTLIKTIENKEKFRWEYGLDDPEEMIF